MTKKIFTTVVYNIYSSAIKFIIFIVIARLLSKEDFGIYNFWISFFSLSSLFLVFGFHRVIFKFRDIKTLNLFIKISILNFILFILFFYIFQEINTINIISTLKNEKYIIVYPLLLSIFSVFFAYFRVISLIKVENFYVKFLYPSLFLLVLLYLFFMNIEYRYIHILTIDAIILFILLLVAFYFYFDYFKGLFSIKLKYNKHEILKYSFKILITNIFIRATFIFDILFIGWLLSSNEVAEYSVALKLTLGITIIVGAFSQVFEKYLSKTDDFTKNLKEINNLLFSSILFISIIILLFYDEIIYLFGVDYKNIKTLLTILLISKIFDALFGLYSIVLIYNNKENLMIKISFISFILSIVLNYLFIINFGIIGASYASLISIFILGLMVYIQLNRISPINYFSNNIYFWIVSLFSILFFISLNIINTDINIVLKFFIVLVLLIFWFRLNIKNIKIIRNINE